MGYTVICGPKGNDFLAVLVIKKVTILDILVSKRVYVLKYCLEFSFFLSYFFMIIDKAVNKTPP